MNDVIIEGIPHVADQFFSAPCIECAEEIPADHCQKRYSHDHKCDDVKVTLKERISAHIIYDRPQKGRNIRFLFTDHGIHRICYYPGVYQIKQCHQCTEDHAEYKISLAAP